MFAGNFAPRGYAFCNGQLLNITSNTALYAVLGTQYGGDGRSTFALPNLQGRFPVNQGQGTGLSRYTIGQTGGEITHTINIAETPGHTHSFTADTQNATGSDASGAFFGKLAGRTAAYYGSASPTVQMPGNAVLPNSGDQPHPNQQAYLAVNFIIALQGIFPPRQ